ncbi:MAG: adenosine deaminase [Planctomycetota bacterium]
MPSIPAASDPWFQQIPKIELHLHLEGAIPYSALWQLVQKYKGDVQSYEELTQRFQYRDFSHFIQTWIWKNQFLREYEDFTFFAEAVARDLSHQNISYVEAFFSPPDFERHGLEIQKLIEAVSIGFDQVPEIKIQLVIDLVRDYGAIRGMNTLNKLVEMKHPRVIGIGIGGSEHLFPPELFEEVYHQAHQLGWFTSAHAGEVAGASSIWGAIRKLRVHRIGHGTRAKEDPKLLNYLVENQVPLEMCPISNLRTGVTLNIAEHPIHDYFQRGILVTVNTDDPKMFGNSLAGEFALLEKEQHFSRPEICKLILNGIYSAWLSPEEKKLMQQQFEEHPLWLKPLSIKS